MAEATFNKDRHVKYFLRCLKTYLPDAYTSSDSNRMLLAFFTLSGLDILGALESSTTPDERRGYIEWIYHCQVPTGGFRGFTGADFGLDKRTTENEIWDPANVPSTFFALVSLIILGDDLSRVKRRECLRWLPRMQRADGSFGEVLGANWKIEGGRDLRFCCCAAGTRYMLRGRTGSGLEDVEDIDVDRLVRFIEDCQSYDGGMAEAPFCEAHAGHTYCAVGALTFLGRLSRDAKPVKLVSSDTREFESLVRWLVARQTSDLGEESDEEDTDSAEREQSRHRNQAGLDDQARQLPSLQPCGEPLRWAGFNGRYNKTADTCYCFWNTGALAMIEQLTLVDAGLNRRYLLEKTQHMIGGFGKGIGDPPDLLHSYLGLVALALHGEEGLDSVDAALCASQRAARHLQALPWWQTSGLEKG